MNERVLVTGAGGFIGSHLTEALLEKGHHVRAMVHYNGCSSEHPLQCSKQLGVA